MVALRSRSRTAFRTRCNSSSRTATASSWSRTTSIRLRTEWPCLRARRRRSSTRSWRRSSSFRSGTAAAIVIAVAIALSAYEAAGIDDRVVRAADTMEHLRGVRFSLEANVSATGSGAVGDVSSRYRGTGELVPPDRMRLVVTEPRPATLVIVGQRVLLDG